MNYIGETVKHKEYGLGTVVEQSGRLITVVFPMHGKKVFKKSILERHVMRIVDKESEEIKEFLRTRKIRHLIHFTQLDNLSSILDRGILPKNDLIKEGIEGHFNDLQRLDGCGDCSCLSIEYPNVWLLDRYRSSTLNSRWAILVLNAELLINHTNYYARHNAGSNEVRSIIRTCNTIKDFKNLYSENFTIHLTTGSRDVSRVGIEGLNYLPTSDQAEILTKGRISPGEIQTIIFQTDEDKVPFENDERCRKIRMLVNSSLFDTYRRDYKGFSIR